MGSARFSAYGRLVEAAQLTADRIQLFLDEVANIEARLEGLMSQKVDVEQRLKSAIITENTFRIDRSKEELTEIAESFRNLEDERDRLRGN